MPGPAAIAVPGAMAAAKHMAFQASAYIDVSTVTSAAFTAWMAQWIWKRLPLWIKEDISFRNLLKNKDEVTKEELSHLGSVVDKLQELAKSAKLEAEVPQLHAALLAFIQLSGQIKSEQVEVATTDETYDVTATRDFLYRSAGRPRDLKDVRCEEFCDALTVATWAYYDDTEVLIEKLNEVGYSLLGHSLVARPGHVAYFIALSEETKAVVVGVRGTSSLEDIITDCCGRAVPLDDDAENIDSIRIEVKAAMPNTVIADDGDVEVVSGHERIYFENHDDDGDIFVRCHEGILISSRRMIDKIEPIIKDLVLECGYGLVFCGHSLGAGAATLGALILRSRFPQLVGKDKEQIRVYAFAPPPVLDHDSAVAAAPFCTSIVNNADVIPRCSLCNLSVFLECLREVQSRLVEEGISPTGPRSTSAFIGKLSEGIGGKPLMTSAELNETIRQAHDKVKLRKPEHLYIPGRVLLLYNPWIEDEAIKQHLDFETWCCTETDGASAVFRTLEIDGPRMFTNHMTSSYFEALGMEYKF